MQMEMESASSPFKVSGASPSPRRQLPMSQYASAGEVSSVDSSVHGQPSHRVREHTPPAQVPAFDAHLRRADKDCGRIDVAIRRL